MRALLAGSALAVVACLAGVGAASLSPGHARQCSTDTECAWMHGGNGGPEPDLSEGVLVGLYCEGPSLVAVAREEDRLPRCGSIQRHALH